jgi:hypothetical protein
MLAVLRKMMAKDPNYRYQEPIEVADALSQWADLPITPPPVREMPVHCPLVQALAGPTAPASGAPLARVLFGRGGGVFSRSGTDSASSLGAGSRAGNGTSPSTVSFGTGTGSNPAYPRGADGVGPVSTARASASPTSPLPRSEPGSGTVPAFADPGSASHEVFHHKASLYIIIGILLALLFAVGAIAAYYVGRAEAGKSALGTVGIPTQSPMIG